MRSIAHQYSSAHLVEDFSKFILSLNSLNGFNEKHCENFINCEILFPAPSLGITRVDIFLKHMAILKLAWEHFSNHFSISRDGYQRRVGGFLLERLHSFLLYEEITVKKNYRRNYYKIILVLNNIFTITLCEHCFMYFFSRLKTYNFFINFFIDCIS